jgi:aurora kinase
LRQWTLLDFGLGHPLGKGKFGRVFVAKTRAVGGGAENQEFVVALKALYKDEIKKEGMELQVRRELEIQTNLRYVVDPGAAFDPSADISWQTPACPSSVRLLS